MPLSTPKGHFFRERRTKHHESSPVHRVGGCGIAAGRLACCAATSARAPLQAEVRSAPSACSARTSEMLRWTSRSPWPIEDSRRSKTTEGATAPWPSRNASPAPCKSSASKVGVFVATADFNNVTFASDKPEARAAILKQHARRGGSAASRRSARWCTVVPGRYDLRLSWNYQMALVV